MDIYLGGMKVQMNRLIEEGNYPGKISNFIKGDSVSFGSTIMDTVIIEVEVTSKHGVIKKEKAFILSNKKDSELMMFLNTFKEFSQDNELDLESLVGKEVMVNISHSTSRRGNIYANISSIERKKVIDGNFK